MVIHMSPTPTESAPNEASRKVAANVTAALTDAGYTTILAIHNATAIPRPTLQRSLTGDCDRTLTVIELAKIARLVGMSIADLITYEPEQRAS